MLSYVHWFFFHVFLDSFGIFLGVLVRTDPPKSLLACGFGYACIFMELGFSANSDRLNNTWDGRRVACEPLPVTPLKRMNPWGLCAVSWSPGPIRTVASPWGCPRRDWWNPGYTVAGIWQQSLEEKLLNICMDTEWPSRLQNPIAALLAYYYNLL